MKAMTSCRNISNKWAINSTTAAPQSTRWSSQNHFLNSWSTTFRTLLSTASGTKPA